jgi:hypothetical protein
VTQSRTRSCPLAAHLHASCSFLGATSRIVSLIPVRALGPDHKRAKKSDSRFVKSAIWTYFCVIPSVWKCGNCVDRLPFLNEFTLRSTDFSSQYLPYMRTPSQIVALIYTLTQVSLSPFPHQPSCVSPTACHYVWTTVQVSRCYLVGIFIIFYVLHIFFWFLPTPLDVY